MLAVTLQLLSKSSLTLKDSEPLIRAGGHLPRDCLSFVTGRWKKTNAPGEVMEVKNVSFFPSGLSIRGRPQKTFAGLFKKSSEFVRNGRSGIT